MRVALAVAVLVGLAVPGCVVHARPLHPVVVVHDDHPGPSGVVWVEERAHVHGDHCGHYWYNGRWYFHAGHRHGPGCGHILHNGLWALAVIHKEVRGHMHDAHCGHYHHDGRWYFMKGHVHGRGCGHEVRGGIWVSVRW